MQIFAPGGFLRGHFRGMWILNHHAAPIESSSTLIPATWSPPPFPSLFFPSFQLSNMNEAGLSCDEVTWYTGFSKMANALYIKDSDKDGRWRK